MYKPWNEVIKGKSEEDLKRIYIGLTAHTDRELMHEPAQYRWYKNMQKLYEKPKHKHESHNSKHKTTKRKTIPNWEWNLMYKR